MGFELGEIEWKDIDVAKLVFFTSLATVLDNAIAFPFWAMKTRQQVERGIDFKAIDTMSKSTKLSLGGIRSLYRGFFVYSVASMPAYLTYLATYQWSKSALGFSNENTNPLQALMVPLAAGMIADVACLGFYVPVDVIVQRLQLPGRYGGLGHVVRDLWKEQGVRAFYRGFGATVVTSAISSGVWWLAYENIKKALTGAAAERKLAAQTSSSAALPPTRGGGQLPAPLASNPRHLPAPAFFDAGALAVRMAEATEALKRSMPHICAGFIAGAAAACISNPFDIFKTRLQTSAAKPGAFTFFRGLKTLVREEGIRGAFLRGLVPKLITMAPLGAVSSVMYEGIMYFSRKTTPELVQRPKLA